MAPEMPFGPLRTPSWTSIGRRFLVSRAELVVKNPFLVRRGAGKKSGDGLVCVCVSIW
jgi:hypothetical protein